jgi:hypothetical protein
MHASSVASCLAYPSGVKPKSRSPCLATKCFVGQRCSRRSHPRDRSVASAGTVSDLSAPASAARSVGKRIFWIVPRPALMRFVRFTISSPPPTTRFLWLAGLGRLLNSALDASFRGRQHPLL